MSIFAGSIKLAGVGPREVRVVASGGSVDRQGDILEPGGVDLKDYKRNPVVLYQHDHRSPIARTISIGIVGSEIQALVRFPDEGVAPQSDQVYSLVKSGTVSAVSVGFMPIEGRPIATGTRYTRWSLLELSFVSVPANANALVIARAQLSPQGQAKLRYRQFRDEMERTDPEVVRSRARRLLAELQKQGAR